VNFPSSLGDLGGRIGVFALLQQEGEYAGLRGVVRVTGTVANAAYLDYWSRHVSIVSDPSDGLHRTGNARRIHDTNVVALPDGTFRYVFHAFAALNTRRIAAGRPPLLSLPPEHVARGEEALARLGLPPGQWFVTLHARHGGYKRDHADHRKRYMNSDIMTYVPVIQAIVERGGWVVRLGDPAMPPLPAMDQVVDLATAPDRSDWLDVYVLALPVPWTARAEVAASFGVPVAVANLFPVTMTGSSPQISSGRRCLPPGTAGSPFAEVFVRRSSDARGHPFGWDRRGRQRARRARRPRRRDVRAGDGAWREHRGRGPAGTLQRSPRAARSSRWDGCAPRSCRSTRRCCRGTHRGLDEAADENWALTVPSERCSE
jgi:hypothetical protein